MQILDIQVTSAKQLSELSKSYERVQAIENEQKTFHRKGVEAQIESTKTLKEQKEDQVLIKVTLDSLLKHNLEQARHQEAQEQIETARYSENLKFSKIAAWTGIAGAALGIISIVLQFIL